MIERKAMLISLGLIALISMAGLAVWATLPGGEPIAVHFDGNGAPDGWVEPARAFLFLPASCLFVWGFFVFLRRAHPDRPVRSAAAMFYAPVLLLALTQFYMITHALGLDWSGPRLFGVAIGLVWVMMGNAMGKLHPGHPFGIRTPWTLGDPHIWDQTNRFGGRAMVLAGLAAIILTFALPTGWLLLMGLASLPVMMIVANVAKSWLLWRQRHPGESALTRPGALWPLAIGGAAALAMLLDAAFEQGRSVGVIVAVFAVAVIFARYRRTHRGRRKGTSS